MTLTLIFGDEREFQVHHFAKKLRHLGRLVKCLLLSDFPNKNSISWEPDCGQGYIHLGEKSYSFNDIKSVYWHRADCSRDEDISSVRWLKKETQSALSPLLNCQGIRWVNSLSSLQYHLNKPRQLNHAVRLGALIPPTYIGNNPEHAFAFLSRHKDCIFKPVQGGCLTKCVNKELRDMDHLKQALCKAPVTLQEKVGSTNIRTYVLGNRILSAELVSSQIDFREDVETRAKVVTLPEREANLARRICRGFGMVWCAIDWRTDNYGNYFFLEANPCPYFHRFEELSGLPVSDELSRLLLH